MSNSKVANGSNLYDAVTGACIGFIDLQGREQVFDTGFTTGQVNKAGHRVLVAFASTGEKASPQYPVSDNATYSRTNGVVSVQCMPFPDADVSRYVRISNQNRLDLNAYCRVLSSTVVAGPKQLITAQELTTSIRPDVPAGSVHGAALNVVDMQSQTNTHSWLQKLNQACGGVLDITNVSAAGSVPSDWQDPTFRAYIESLGYFDTIITDVGLGNAITAPTASSESILAVVDDDIAWLKTRGRDVIFAGIAGGRPGGDSGLIAAPQLTPDFTTLQRTGHYLRKHLAERWPTVQYADIESDACRAAMYGSADNSDLLTGRPPMELNGQDGIHWTPAMGDVVADAIAPMILKRLPTWQPFGNNHPDNVFDNPTADFGGGLNPAGIQSWHGNVATQSVVVSGLVFIGTGVEGTSGSGSGFTANMSGTLKLVNGKRRCREMELVLLDPSDGGAVFNLDWHGTTARPLKDVLNNAAFRGVDLDLWWDFGVTGFRQSSVFKIRAGLWATTATDTRCICSPLEDTGANTMFTAARGWVHGMNGPTRIGPVRVPANVYTDAFLRISVQGVPGVPWNKLKVRWGEMRLAARQLLLT